MDDDVEDGGAGANLSPISIKPFDSLQVLDVFPSELRIQCENSSHCVFAGFYLILGQLNTEVSYTLSLKNIVDRVVAFKVKTTAPKRYMVR